MWKILHQWALEESESIETLPDLTAQLTVWSLSWRVITAVSQQFIEISLFPVTNYKTRFLCYLHTLGILKPLAAEHQADSLIWNNTAKQLWQPFCHLVNHLCLRVQRVTTLHEEGFISNLACGEVTTSEVTLWSTRQQEVFKLLPLWGNNMFYSSKRSAVFGEYEPWITRSTMNRELSPFFFWIKALLVSMAQRINLRSRSPSVFMHLYLLCETYPRVVWTDDRPASQRAVCWSAGPRWRCVQSICWLSPTCWSSSQSSRPRLRTWWRQTGGTNTHDPAALRSARSHRTLRSI